MRYSEKNLNRTEVWVCFGDVYKGPREKVGYLPNKAVYTYIDKLNSFVPSQNRCMQYHFYSVLHSHPIKRNGKMLLNQSLYIVATNINYVKYLCGAKNGETCLRCIKHGQCKEDFIRECVTKQFLADKNKENNQR